MTEKEQHQGAAELKERPPAQNAESSIKEQLQPDGKPAKDMNAANVLAAYEMNSAKKVIVSEVQDFVNGLPDFRSQFDLSSGGKEDGSALPDEQAERVQKAVVSLFSTLKLHRASIKKKVKRSKRVSCGSDSREKEPAVSPIDAELSPISAKIDDLLIIDHELLKEVIDSIASSAAPAEKAMSDLNSVLADYPGLADELASAISLAGNSCDWRSKAKIILSNRKMADSVKINTILANLESLRKFQQLWHCSLEEIKPELESLKAGYQDYLNIRNSMITLNTGLAMFWAKKFMGRGLPLDDLFQDGIIGLISAVDRFNYKLGNNFASYAGFWIRQSIGRDLEKMIYAVNVPANIIAMKRKLKSVSQEFYLTSRRYPDSSELAALTGYPEKKIRELPEFEDCVSLDGPAGPDRQDLVADHLADPNSQPSDEYSAQNQQKRIINEGLENLTDRERFVLKCRYGFGCQERTLKETGQCLGLSGEQVRNIQNKAHNKMQAWLVENPSFSL
ncbi:MAG: sigma-70 family RNA polymerase sigma factor [Deltaproteobacteria bacterium]|jgi:RNA polymerase primary sigma factor|nr:sigma-70 family RNA polymerase sigma factor [Deltaproteobacteria bacterium]